jgi:6-phosphofructokinase 1
MSAFTIEKIGIPEIESPIKLSKIDGDFKPNFVKDEELVLFNIEKYNKNDHSEQKQNWLEKAGPREKIYFEPAKSHAAIVTCGGLCPGINDVIRSIVMCLWYRYGITKINGYRNGFRGMIEEFKLPLKQLSPEIVTDIQRKGGTILGSSRGSGERVTSIVSTLEKDGVNLLFVIGGDGTQKGTLEIAKEAEKRGVRIAVVGIPKTIDNDFKYIQKSFGFETAVAEAEEFVTRAHVEAHDAVNGISIVKVMGRESGFIAAHTALAQNDVNFILIPEVPFELNGENGLLYHLHKRIIKRHHAVVLVAEGAGQEILGQSEKYDASGNKILQDVGIFLKEKIKDYFKQKKIETTIRYFDPSYLIRSAPVNTNDSLYCMRLGNNAVHAIMSGRTKLMVCIVNNHFVHIPIKIVTAERNKVNPESSLWRDVIDATGQPPLMVNA